MPQMEPDRNAMLRLQAHYSSLRLSEKKAADYILNNPENAIYQSITTLAENAQVSETSVIRLCKAIGYHGFQDFKINVARGATEPRRQIHEEISDSDDVPAIISKVMNANIKAVSDTMNFLDPQQMQLAVDAIAATSRLEFYGLGGSGVVAKDAQHMFFKYIDGACIAYSDPHMQAMSASTMGPGDVAVGISHTGRTKDIVESMRIAHQTGATTICITGGIKSPVTKNSDIVLTVVSKEQFYKPEPMSSRIAQLSVIDALATAVACTRPEMILDNLQKTRKALTDKRY